MAIRKITSLTAGLAFILVLLTSIILYIVPQGRVAYWADWRLWGFTKEQWGNIHIVNGLLFLLSLFLHIYYNWRPIVSYMKNKAKALKIFTKEFNVALGLTFMFTFGTLIEVPPFQWVLDLNGYIKDAAAVKYGEPPYGHAELSALKTFAKKQGLDLKESMASLKSAGMKFDSEKQTLKDIARQNNVSPQQVYIAMKPVESVSKTTSLPDSPPPGFGKRNLADICQEYQLNVKAVVRGLAEKNIKTDTDMTIKSIAEAHSVGPMDVFEAIKEITTSSQAPTTASRQPIPKGDKTAGNDTPIGLGKMTLVQVVEKYNLDQSSAIQKLSENGISAKSDDKMKKIAEKHETTPFDLFEMMK
jgi:hypothetical protein